MKEDSVVYNKEGNPVPQYPARSNQGNGAITTYWMPFDEYCQLDEIFCQRDTKARFNKAKGHLSILKPEHCQVSIAKLTKNDEIMGRRYKAGKRFVSDSNTRKLIWTLGASDKIPQEVLVIEYSYDNLLDIQQSYNTFDSTDSVEKNQEKLAGVFKMYGWEPQSSKLQKGTILSALNKACNFYFPDIWNQPEKLTQQSLLAQVGVFLQEIKALDPVLKDAGHWDQSQLCAALMALKRYGTTSDKLNAGLQQINDRGADTRDPKKWDGITHIVDEWKTNDFFEVKSTGWSMMNNTVSYCLYWIDKYMKDEKGSKPGGNWRNRGAEYKNLPQATDHLQQLTSTVTAGFLQAGDLALVKDEAA